MPESASADIFLFGGFRLDRHGGGLFRLDPDGCQTPISLGSRALDLLALLADRAGDVVLKDTIMAVVWPGKVVEEGNLNVQISKLRRVLGQNPDLRGCIQTVTGYGYRFIAPVTRTGRTALTAYEPGPSHRGRPGVGDGAATAYDPFLAPGGSIIGLASVARVLDTSWADTTTPHGRLMLTVLQGLAQFERDISGK